MYIEEFDNLKTKMLKYIMYKKRTEKEIRQKFANCDENMVDDAIEYLTEAGYISDKNYVERAIEEFEFYKTIEELAPIAFEEYKKISKVMCANVDFYSGLVYTMLNIPKELYTPIFAISRIAGWSAHRLEELAVSNRIIRPAYKNVGGKQPYVSLMDREE